MLSMRNHPIIGGRKNRTVIPEKLAFELWMDRGSARQAAETLFNEYGEGNNGKPFSRKAVEQAAKRFVLWNVQEARDMYEAKYGELNDEVWYEYLKKLHNYNLMFYAPTIITKWREANPEAYEYIKQHS